MAKIFQFSQYQRQKVTEQLFAEFTACVSRGDYLQLDNIMMQLVTMSSTSLPLLIIQLKKYYLLSDDRMVSAIRDLLIQIGRPTLPWLLDDKVKSANWPFFSDIATEIYIAEMIDNFFLWKERHVSEEVYHLRQVSVVNELVELGSAAVPQLMRNLVNMNIREYLVQVLGKLGDRQATGVLVALLRERWQNRRVKNRPVYHLVAKALGQINDERAVGALLEFLGNDVPNGKREAAAAIEKILEQCFGHYQNYGQDKRLWKLYQRRILTYLEQKHTKCQLGLVR